MSVIVTDTIVKQYGRVQALRGVSIHVERGEIFGLLGQNGAGKTTLIKVLLGVISATQGKATVLGEPAGSTHARRRIGYLPEDHRFPEFHTAASLLDFYGALLDVPRTVRRQRIPQVLELVGLKGRMHSKIRTYSKGMKQRVGLAQALMHHPELIFLDEPTDGVDPIGRREIRELLQQLKSQGMTIFINSHLLGEVELLCDRVAILQRGKIVQAGDIPSLTQQRGTWLLGLAPGEAFPFAEVDRLGYRAQARGKLVELVLLDEQGIDPVLALLHQSGLRLRHLVEKRQTLEDLFIATVEAAEPGVDDAPVARRPRESARS
ncbi:MAG: ABC transporter ATP-binding protein [Gemmataceae bacterium]